MRHFANVDKTTVEHYSGKVEIFNGDLMAIAGRKTRKVEIMANGQWESILPVGNRDGTHEWFSSLIIPGNPTDTLFVFGIYL